MRLGIKPTVDVVFKSILGDENHTDKTINFLNAVLARAGRRLLVSLSIINPFRIDQFLSDKDAVLDIRARDESGREFQLEVQVQSFDALPRRMLHNWASCYLSRIKKGQEYDSLSPVVSIWLLETDLFRDGRWFHAFALRDEETGEAFLEDELILIIELASWARVRSSASVEGIEEELERWLYLFWKGEDLDPEKTPSFLSGQAFREALEIMTAYTKTDEARDLYRRRMDFRSTMASLKAEAKRAQEALRIAEKECRAQGLAEGLAKGRAEGSCEARLHDAKRLKELGVTIEIIAKGTGLSEEEITEL